MMTFRAQSMLTPNNYYLHFVFRLFMNYGQCEQIPIIPKIMGV